MTEEELERLAILYKGVSMATTWSIDSDEITADDVQACLAAVPKLLAELEKQKRSLEVSRLGTEFVKLKAIGAARSHVDAADATADEARKAHHNAYAEALMTIVKMIEAAHDAHLAALDAARGVTHA